MMKTQDNTETIIFLSLLNDECECEINHVQTVCSHKVTHRQKSCDFDFLTCFNSAANMMQHPEYILRKGRTCQFCKRDLFDCWTIIPV